MSNLVNTNGMILKGIGGFYYVETTYGVIECRARGKFRNQKQTPCPGDNVAIELLGDQKGYVLSIGERKNYLPRPTVANLDKLLIVVSCERPRPNLYNIDCMTAILDYKGIEPVVVITKTDLAEHTWIEDIYRLSGFRVYCVNNVTGKGTEAVGEELKNSLTAFSGNTGVGKTSLLNAIFPDLRQKTSEISDKLGRGKHTTRQVELFSVPGGGYVADTPGFSTIDAWKYEAITGDQLQYCFREFERFLGKCRFTGCSHTSEPDCAVLQAVKEGLIAPSRHESYCIMYREAKEMKEWEQK